jgi:hypothetical protein
MALLDSIKEMSRKNCENCFNHVAVETLKRLLMPIQENHFDESDERELLLREGDLVLFFLQKKYSITDCECAFTFGGYRF